MNHTIDRMIPVEGEGLVVRWNGGVAVLGGPEAEVHKAVDVLVPIGPDGVRDQPAVDTTLERLRALDLANFAATVYGSDGSQVICRGGGLCEDMESQQTIGGGNGDLLVEESAPGQTLWLGFGHAPFEVDALRSRPTDLVAGIVHGRGVLIDGATVEDQAGSDDSFEIADLRLTEHRAPLPAPSVAGNPNADSETGVVEETGTPEGYDGTIVKGIECGRGHFNNPIARYCSTCGLSLVHLTHRLVDGIRPSLGFLVFDDGSTFTIDRSYLIGREPEPDADSGFAALAANDAEDTVSRHHAELELDEWNVVLRDLGSTNGTSIWNEDLDSWEPLGEGEDRIITTGSRVSIGRRTFVFESIDRT